MKRQIENQGATPNIPSKANRKWKACFSPTLYKDRNRVERFFSKLKFFRLIATRYDKLGSTFMAMIKLASIRIRRSATRHRQTSPPNSPQQAVTLRL